MLWYRQNSLIRYRVYNDTFGITTTRPNQAFFGITNDNLTFDDTVKLYHQYRYN